MPEFILNTDGAGGPWESLDAFTQGFIEAAFFSETACMDSAEFFTDAGQERVSEGQSDGNIPSGSSVADIDSDSFARIKDFCDAFQAKAGDLLQEAYSAHWRTAALKAGWSRNSHNGYFVGPVGAATRMADYDSWQELCECEEIETGDEYDDSQAGRDLYFTYAGHGVGYWDRDQLDSDNLGNRLSDACGRGEINLTAYQSDKPASGFLIEFYIG
jgi:hypothetical protein